MDDADFEACTKLLSIGKLKELTEKLGPGLARGDIDAYYLSSLYSTNPNITGEEFDKAQVSEFKKLSKLKQKNALYDLAMKYRLGDDVDKSIESYLILMAGAAIEGHKLALKTMEEELSVLLNNI